MSGGRPRRLLVSPGLEGGVYANDLFISHSFHEFTLDFAVMRTPRRDDEEAELSRGSSAGSASLLRWPSR